MGVTGLWKLIEPCGKPVPVETLEGKVLAVDVSIWLHQVIKGFQDSKGSALPNAHLLGLFHRLCKLLYYRIKPVFVFDGCVPQLKRDTIAYRQQQRSKLNTEADRIQALLLQSLAKEKVVQQALGANVELLLKSPSKKPTAKGAARDDEEDMFKLPELPSSSKKRDHEEDASDACESSRVSYDENSSTDEGSSFDESNARHYYNANLQAIDVKSHHFKDLPADVRHEILVDIKETRKQSSWGRLHELPSRGDDFSVFQMKRLLKRRAVQESLEEAEQEMGGKALTYAELNNIFTEEGILEPNILEKGTKQICSDEHTRFLLVRDLKKKLAKVEEKESEEPCSSKKEDETSAPTRKISTDTVTIVESKEADKLGKEFDTELQLALAISLEDTQVYSQSDYEFEHNEQLKLNRAQRSRLQNAATGPARAYMIEYGGMNEEEVEGIMEKTQVQTDCEDTFQEICGHSMVESNVSIKDQIQMGEQVVDKHESVENSQDKNESQDIRLRMSEDSDTDTDLEEVSETNIQEKPEITAVESRDESELEIVVDLKADLAADDDLFADIFEDNEVSGSEVKKNEEKVTEEKREEIMEASVDVAKVSTVNAVSSQEESKAAESKKFDAESILSDLKVQLDGVKNLKLEDLKYDSNAEAVAKISNVSSTKSEKELKAKAAEVDADSILSNLKTQLHDIKNLKLDDIKIESNVIELSDDESVKNAITCVLPKTPIKTEVIEICDSDDALPTALNSKSPNLKTPQKNLSILDFYPANYVVKRTPDKPAEDEIENVPKVTSPFFVNKTPKSSRKRSAIKDASNSPTPKKAASKASKSLFENECGDDLKHEMEVQVDGVQPIELTPLNTEDLINEAAQKLKEQKTEEELQTLASDLAKERKNLESERNRQDRMGMSISQRMSSECQELLRLFGIPYIVAPMEAEAQCAFLDSIALTNGTITDDSDIWLFGGRTVYKNFFAQNKHVLEFRAEKIENTFNCDRNKLIQLACLVGSDYTTGVHGIGAVTALEILASFTAADSNKEHNKTKEENMREVMNAVLSTLNKFRDWWLAHKSAAAPPGTSARLALRKKLKNIELNDGFPSLAVVEAYLLPKVDDNRDAFSWGYPDVESLREYAKKTFGWTTLKTNEILTPVLKRISEKKSQATIRSYFSVKSALSVRELKVSKRVQHAIDKMAGKIEAETPEKPVKSKTKRATRSKKKQTTTTIEENVESVENLEPIAIAETEEHIEEPSTSQMATRTTRKRAAPDLHNKKSDLVPQREKDKEKMSENMAKAAEVLKKAAKESAATKKKRRS